VSVCVIISCEKYFSNSLSGTFVGFIFSMKITMEMGCGWEQRMRMGWG